jgi:hypothetical protein
MAMTPLQDSTEVSITDRVALALFGISYVELSERQEKIVAAAIIRSAVKDFDA